MDKIIAFIVLLIIYFILLIVMGLLAYLYQIKNQAFINYNKQFFKKWNEYKLKHKNDTLNQTTFKFELPVDEVALLEKDFLISVNDKKNLNKTKLKKEAKQNLIKDFLYDDYLFLKENVKLKKRIDYQLQQATIYLTNKRVVINLLDNYFKILITDIKSISVCVIKKNDQFLDSCYLTTNKQEIQITGEVFDFVLTIQKLIRKRDENNDK
ncbi:Hypothetical protein, predicted transmembrane protein [Mycoplasma yeatsii 13926]|uniref:Transmembrane protein n=1 Tax=Mycoplasma yeatsii 13926 TaxID=1188240 RepID=S6G732_9MOLU|nr:hypothetical protein [Mycoplasma yeatsii]EOA07568.1 Hypothetical protein, predicted transmembrane protein [Mycoplasma yeatsii 13926]